MLDLLFVLVLALSLNPSSPQFTIYLPVIAHQQQLQSQLSLQKKQIYVDVDLIEPVLQVCCKPNRNVFDIVHSFLANPFFQINQYMCPAVPGQWKYSQINLASIGVVEMKHEIVEYPACRVGKLGLNKQSIFLSYLPVNAHTIKIQINQNTSPNNKVSLYFGQIDGKNQDSWVFSSKDQKLWDMQVKSIKLGMLAIQQNSTIVFDSTQASIKIPQLFYQKLISYFPTNQTCKIINYKLYCLCQSGIPASFPKFQITLSNNQTLQIQPSVYMKIDSNICQMLFNPSPDTNWYFNVLFFQKTIFYLNHLSQQIIIKKKQISDNESSQLINLPIPLILNCAVVLLLCIFASLVIIEIMKRISGISDLREETLEQYIIRRGLDVA